LIKTTPYIYILFLLGAIHTIHSQENKTLIIEGSSPNSSIIIKQIGYEKEIAHDTLYENEIKIFRKKLNQSGFIQNEIDSVFKNDSIYYVKFKFNKSIKKISLVHPDLAFLAKNLGYDSNSENSVEIPFINLASFIDDMIYYYQNNAYPFVKIYLSNIKKEYDLITADLNIDKNDKRTIDKIIIKGYADFPKSFVHQQFNINTNDPFSKKKIAQISNFVQSTPFVSEIKKPEVLFTRDSTSLYIYLKREKSNFFDGLIGFSTSPENNKIQLYGNVDLKIQNSLNQGESLQLNWLASQNQSQSLKLLLEMPYIYSTPFVVGYKFGIHKQDTTFTATSHHFKTDYQLTTNHKIGFVLETEKSNTTSDHINPNITNFSSYFYGISYTFNKPNNHPVFNKKIFLTSYVSQGKRDETNQNKIANQIQYLVRISKNHNLLLKNTTEILISDNYLENELFRIGGSTSIRGFDENSFFTDSYSYLNTAYNYLLDDSSYLSVLVDLGLLRNNLDSSLLTTYSFGIGFSQQTKIGQLGVQYFVGNTDKDSFDFTNSKLHIKLTQPF